MQSTLAPTSSRMRPLRGRGKNCGQRRTIHAGNRAQHHFGRRHGGAGVAGGHKPGGLAFAHQPQSHAQGRVALGAHRLHRFVLHGDDFAGVHDFDGQAGGGRIALQFRPDALCRARPADGNAIVPGGLNGAFDLRLRRPVGTHRVQSYDAWHGVAELAGFFDVQNFTALVVAALGAGAMRQLALVAVRTLGKRAAFKASCARRVLVRFWECRRFGLGMDSSRGPCAAGFLSL